MASAAVPRSRFPASARRGLVALAMAASALSIGVSTTPTAVAQDGCAQPYKPMWIHVTGIGLEVDPWPLHPHDPPFWVGDVGQPGGPTVVGGVPPHSYADGVLTVGEGDDAATFEGRAVTSDVFVGLVEFEGRRYLSLQSSIQHGSFKSIIVFWDFDDPCRQLPDTTVTPSTPGVTPSAPPADGGEQPAGPAAPVPGTAAYTG